MKYALCSACLADGRTQPLQYDLLRDYYICMVHGPWMTNQVVWDTMMPSVN